MNEVLEWIVQLEESTDVRWSADAFSHLLTLARSGRLGPDALAAYDKNTSLPIYGAAGAKLLFELRRALENPRSVDLAWQAVGILMCWAMDIHVRGKDSLRAELARRARDERGSSRHSEPLPTGGDDAVLETNLALVLDAVASVVTSGRGVIPPYLEDFFSRGIQLPFSSEVGESRAAGVPPLPFPLYGGSRLYPQRVAVTVEASLERFVTSLHASRNPAAQWLAHDFSRSIIAKTGRICVPAFVRGILGRLLVSSGDAAAATGGGPSSQDNARLASFLLSQLDVSTPGDIENEVADDLILGGFSGLNFVCERLALSSDNDEDMLAQRTFALMQRKWPAVFQDKQQAIHVLAGFEALLQKRLDARQRLDNLTLRSMAQALIISHSSLRRLQAQEQPLLGDDDEIIELVEANFRVSLLMALSTDRPAEIFSFALASKPATTPGPLSEEAVRLVGLALGCPQLDAAVEAAVCDTLLYAMMMRGEEDMLLTSWRVGQVALEAGEWTDALDLWQYDLSLAASRMSSKVIPSVPKQPRAMTNHTSLMDELDRIEALFLGLHGLESKGSIRHLQDAASFYIHSGRKKGFNQASERFLEDCARALNDFGRFWECGNCRIMLATCHLAAKKWSLASVEYCASVDAFERCGALAEADAVRASCRAFVGAATDPREWDWCFDSGRRNEDRTAIAHYFLVGAVGLGDPDLTVIRCVSMSSKAAFDDAISVLEHGSLRRRVHGELRWVGEVGSGIISPHFFPAQSAPVEEYGFWIQRVWPVAGESSSGPQHCPRRFGIAGEPSVLVEVNTRRGLNPLISAASVAVRGDAAGVSAPSLDVPYGWMPDEEEMQPKPPNHPPAVDQLNIPLPPGPPPNDEQDEYEEDDLPYSKFKTAIPRSFENKRVLESQQYSGSDEFSGESKHKRSSGSNRVTASASGSGSNTAQQEYASSSTGGTAQDMVETDAERKKREFREKKRQKEAAASAIQNSPPTPVVIDASGEDEIRQRRAIQLEEDYIEPPPPGNSPSPISGDEILDHSIQDIDSTNLLLHRRRGKQGTASPYESAGPAISANRRVQLVDGADLEDVINSQAALPTRKITLVEKPQRASNRKLILEDDGLGSSNRQPKTPPQQRHDNDIEELPPHSASRAFFSVGGARVTVEEAALVKKCVSSGEGWISALLLSAPKHTSVSIKFSGETMTMQIFAEPSFDQLDTVKLTQGVTLDPLPSDGNILELFDPDRLAKAKAPLLFSCDRPDLFRALLGSFKASE